MPAQNAASARTIKIEVADTHNFELTPCHHSSIQSAIWIIKPRARIKSENEGLATERTKRRSEWFAPIFSAVPMSIMQFEAKDRCLLLFGVRTVIFISPFINPSHEHECFQKTNRSATNRSIDSTAQYNPPTAEFFGNTVVFLRLNLHGHMHVFCL